MVFFFSLLVAFVPSGQIKVYCEVLAIYVKNDALLVADRKRAQATAEFIARVDAILAQSQHETSLSKKIVALAEQEDAEADPVKKATLKAERKQVYAEYRRVRGLPPKP